MNLLAHLILQPGSTRSDLFDCPFVFCNGQRAAFSAIQSTARQRIFALSSSNFWLSGSVRTEANAFFKNVQGLGSLGLLRPRSGFFKNDGLIQGGGQKEGKVSVSREFSKIIVDNGAKMFFNSAKELDPDRDIKKSD